MTLTVGQLAKLTGLTVRTLHHYDAIGLLVPSHRSGSGYRLYAQQDVVRLYQIVALQRLGLSLTDIEGALKSDRNSLSHIVAQQLAELDEQIADTTRTRDHLRVIHNRLARGDEPSVNQWLSALELMAVHGRHYSPEEWQQILHNAEEIKDAWPALIEDIRAVVAIAQARAGGLCSRDHTDARDPWEARPQRTIWSGPRLGGSLARRTSDHPRSSGARAVDRCAGGDVRRRRSIPRRRMASCSDES